MLRTLLALLLLLPTLALSACAQQALVNSRSGGQADETANGSQYEPPGDPFEGDDDEPTSDDDDDDGAGGEAEIVSYDPEPGATDHHYRAPIVLEFAAYDAGAWVSLYDTASNYEQPIEHEWSKDGTVLTATPAHFLQPGSDYVVSIDLGEAALEYSFSTSNIGMPLTGGIDDVAGRTYAISFAGVNSAHNSEFAGLLSSAGGPTWLWSVGAEPDADGDGLEDMSITSGVGLFDEAWYQDLCTPTAMLEAGSPATLEDPYFATDSGPMTLNIDGVAIEFEAAGYDGDFTPSGEQIVEVGIWGWLVADSVASLAGATPACDWLADNASLTCAPCPSGVGECAWLEVDGLSGDAAELDFADVDADGIEECGGEPLSVLGCSVSRFPGSSLLALLVAFGAVAVRRFRR